METEALIFAVGLPMAAMCLCLFLGRQGVSKEENWGAGLGFAAAYLSVHLGTHGLPAGETIESWEWLLLLIPLASVMGAILVWIRIPIWGRLIAYAGFSCATGWLVVPSFQSQPWLWRGVIASLVFVGWSLGIGARERPLRWLLPLIWLLIGAASLPVLIASANARFGLMCAALASVSAVALIYGCIWREGNPMRSAVGVMSTAFPAILFSGYFNDYGGVPMATFAVLSVLPLMVGWMVIPRKWLPLAIVVVVVLAIMVGVASIWPIITAESAY